MAKKVSELELRIRQLIQGQISEELKQNLYLAFTYGTVFPLSLLMPLGTLLSQDDAELVRYVIHIVKKYKKKAWDLLPALIKIANNKSKGLEATRFSAVNAIWEISGDPDLVSPFFSDFIDVYPDDGCDLVTRVGKSPKEIIPKLIRVLENEDWDIKWAAVDALGALGRNAAIAKPFLLKLTQHKSAIISGRATEALRKINRK